MLNVSYHSSQHGLKKTKKIFFKLSLLHIRILTFEGVAKRELQIYRVFRQDPFLFKNVTDIRPSKEFPLEMGSTSGDLLNVFKSKKLF